MLGIGRSIGDPNQRIEQVFSVDSNNKDFAVIKKGEPHFLTQAQVPVDNGFRLWAEENLFETLNNWLIYYRAMSMIIYYH